MTELKNLMKNPCVLFKNLYRPVEVKISSINNRSCTINVIWQGVGFGNLSSFKVIHAFKFQHFIGIMTISVPNFFWSKQAQGISHPSSVNIARSMMYDRFTHFLDLAAFIYKYNSLLTLNHKNHKLKILEKAIQSYSQ